MARSLIMDDDKSFREMMSDFLERKGYDVTAEPDGEDCIRLCHKIKPDVVIADLFMPSGGMSNIQKLLEEFPDIKIIAVSGGNVVSGGYLELTKSKTRIKHSFQKPFEMDEMLTAIKEILNK